MRRFYLPELTRESTSVEITGDEFSHMKKALRLKVGTEVELFNGRDTILYGTIASVEKRFVRVDIIGVVGGGAEGGLNESSVDIVLVQALVKGAKPEFIIQKATELGVSEIRFYSSGRSVPSLADVTDKKAEAKLVRWNRVAVEAAKQCRRGVVPHVAFYDCLKEALETVGNTVRSDSGLPAVGLLFTVASSSDEATFETPPSSLREALKGFAGCDTLLVVVGPEGGIDGREQGVAVAAGLTPVSLGPRTLRTETAAVTALSILQYVLGDIS